MAPSIALFAIGAAPLSHAAEINWIVTPSYVSPSKTNGGTALRIADSELYSESNAVIISEGAYSGGYHELKSEANRSEGLIRKKLERIGFKVFVWRDLNGRNMNTVLDQVSRTLGRRNNSRFFFYYFGHGDAIEDTNGDSKGYLVPTDAPNPNKDENGFYQVSLPITRLIQYSSEMSVKHAFFAFEACKAGSIFTTLGGPAPLRKAGYATSENNATSSGREFLTAGTASQNVPANGTFTALLAAGLSGEAQGKDGFVTGIDLATYVKRNAPSFTTTTYPLDPEERHIGLGDIILSSIPSPIASPTSPPKDPKSVEVAAMPVENNFRLGDRIVQNVIWPLVLKKGQDNIVRIKSNYSNIVAFAVVYLGPGRSKKIEAKFSQDFGGAYLAIPLPEDFSLSSASIEIHVERKGSRSEETLGRTINVG